MYERLCVGHLGRNDPFGNAFVRFRGEAERFGDELERQKDLFTACEGYWRPYTPSDDLADVHILG